MDVYINPADWSEKTQKSKPGAKKASVINSFIAAKLVEAEAIALDIEAKSKFVTAYYIRTRSSENFQLIPPQLSFFSMKLMLLEQLVLALRH